MARSRTPPPARPLGRRWWWSLGLLGVLAVLTLATVVLWDDDADDDGAASTSTTATLPSPSEGTLPDEELAALLLPQVGALGQEWIETQRDDEATEAEALPPEGCANFPIPEGYVTHGEHQRTQGASIVEALSVTAGVTAEGVEPPSLDDEEIVGCLLDALRASLADDVTAEVADDVAIGAPPAGALVSHLRIVVTGDPPVGGTFDFVLVRRDRLVSLGLLQGVEPDAVTPLDIVAAALDVPLQAALPLLE